MERAISEMEKIRRAEEISSRRNNSKSSDEVKKPKNIYKTILNIVLLINVIIFVVAFQNREYIFSDEFLVQMNTYNINVKSWIENLLSEEEDISIEEDETIIDGESAEETENEVTEENGVGGSDETQNVETETEESLSQMEQDAKDIIEKYSVILPLNGTKTSGFGYRESTNSIVTSNHTGVDIAAVTGTVIKAASSGTVSLVSSEGDYGKHLKIENGSLVTLYAHCSKIYVTEGQEVSQGDEIAEVGSTGNSTGPHLHFEIIYDGRYVDPELVVGEL